MVKIWLDAGHGGKDSGAIGNGLQEKNLTLAIMDKIAARLFNYENVVLNYTRRQDTTVELSQRTNWANAWGADYFLSIHINAGGGEGFESYVYTGCVDTSKTNQLRNILHDEIVKATGLKDRGKKKGNLHVCRETSMAASLTESGFIDHAVDASKLKQDSFLNAVADGHVNGLVKMFGLKKKAAAPTPPTQSNKLYLVQVGAYSDKENAEKMCQQLIKAGFPAVIK